MIDRRIRHAGVSSRATAGLPMIYLVDSAGARITDQVDLFPGRRGSGRIFWNQDRRQRPRAFHLQPERRDRVRNRGRDPLSAPIDDLAASSHGS
jgi:hypothetical protein